MYKKVMIVDDKSK